MQDLKEFIDNTNSTLSEITEAVRLVDKKKAMDIVGSLVASDSMVKRMGDELDRLNKENGLDGEFGEREILTAMRNLKLLSKGEESKVGMKIRKAL